MQDIEKRGNPQPFLGGWGGICSLALGFVIAFVSGAIWSFIMTGLEKMLVEFEVIPGTQVAVLYWSRFIFAGFIFAGCSVIYDLPKTKEVLSFLRRGEGDWSMVIGLAIDLGLFLGLDALIEYVPISNAIEFEKYTDAVGWWGLIGLAALFVGTGSIVGFLKRTLFAKHSS